MENELTVDKAYAKMKARWSMPKTQEYMDLFLDNLPNSHHHLIAKTFLFFAIQAEKKPSPGQVASKYWEMRHNEEKANRESKTFLDDLMSGCEKCSNGSVHFRDRGKQVTGRCAICNNQSDHHQFFVQFDNKIFYASKQLGKNLWVPTPNNRVLIPGAVPNYPTALLEESFRLGPIPCPNEFIEKFPDLKIKKSLMALIEAGKKRHAAMMKEVPF